MAPYEPKPLPPTDKVAHDIHTLVKLLAEYRDRIAITSNALAAPTMQVAYVKHSTKDKSILIITKPIKRD